MTDLKKTQARENLIAYLSDPKKYHLDALLKNKNKTIEKSSSDWSKSFVKSLNIIFVSEISDKIEINTCTSIENKNDLIDKILKFYDILEFTKKTLLLENKKHFVRAINNFMNILTSIGGLIKSLQNYTAKDIDEEICELFNIAPEFIINIVEKNVFDFFPTRILKGFDNGLITSLIINCSDFPKIHFITNDTLDILKIFSEINERIDLYFLSERLRKELSELFIESYQLSINRITFEELAGYLDNPAGNATDTATVEKALNLKDVKSRILNANAQIKKELEDKNNPDRFKTVSSLIATSVDEQEQCINKYLDENPSNINAKVEAEKFSNLVDLSLELINSAKIKNTDESTEDMALLGINNLSVDLLSTDELMKDLNNVVVPNTEIKDFVEDSEFMAETKKINLRLLMESDLNAITYACGNSHAFIRLFPMPLQQIEEPDYSRLNKLIDENQLTLENMSERFINTKHIISPKDVRNIINLLQIKKLPSRNPLLNRLKRLENILVDYRTYDITDEDTLYIESFDTRLQKALDCLKIKYPTVLEEDFDPYKLYKEYLKLEGSIKKEMPQSSAASADQAFNDLDAAIKKDETDKNFKKSTEQEKLVNMSVPPSMLLFPEEFEKIKLDELSDEIMLLATDPEIRNYPPERFTPKTESEKKALLELNLDDFKNEIIGKYDIKTSSEILNNLTKEIDLVKKEETQRKKDKIAKIASLFSDENDPHKYQKYHCHKTLENFINYHGSSQGAEIYFDFLKSKFEGASKQIPGDSESFPKNS